MRWDRWELVTSYSTEQVMDPPQCDAGTLQQHAVVSGDLLVEVGQQGDVDVAQTSSLTKHQRNSVKNCVRVSLTQPLLQPSDQSVPCVGCWSMPGGWSGSPRTHPPPHSWRRGTRWPCRWTRWSLSDTRRCWDETKKRGGFTDLITEQPAENMLLWILTNPEGRRTGPGICPWNHPGWAPWTPRCAQLWPWRPEQPGWRPRSIWRQLMETSQTI